jgi:glycosyltransferase involved in cell wall biosynthesis
MLMADKREERREYGAQQPGFHPAMEALLQGFTRIPEVEVHVVTCAQKPMSSPAKLSDTIWFHSLYVPKLGWLRTLYQGCIRAIRRKLAEIQPDIVHGQGTERECAISAVFSGYPNVVTIHGNMIEMARQQNVRPGSFQWLTARLENFTLPRTAGVLCNTAFTESLVRPRARRVWRVPNSVREAFLTPPADRPAPAQCTVLNVGDICSYKRQLELLEVARKLHEERLPVEFRFIGGIETKGPFRVDAAFRERCRSAERDGYGRYMGVLRGDALIRSFDEASALAHVPSAEAFGLVVAEALARNLKFFGARVGGIPDIAEGIEGSELCEDGDWAGLQRMLSRWIRAGWPRPRRAAEAMRQRYSPEIVARRIAEIYREALSNRPARRR